MMQLEVQAVWVWVSHGAVGRERSLHAPERAYRPRMSAHKAATTGYARNCPAACQPSLG